MTKRTFKVVGTQPVQIMVGGDVKRFMPGDEVTIDPNQVRFLVEIGSLSEQRKPKDK